MEYQLTSEFKPTGDQPTAIAKLVEGVNNGEHSQVLLGATGFQPRPSPSGDPSCAELGVRTATGVELASSW